VLTTDEIGAIPIFSCLARAELERLSRTSADIPLLAPTQKRSGCPQRLRGMCVVMCSTATISRRLGAGRLAVIHISSKLVRRASSHVEMFGSAQSSALHQLWAREAWRSHSSISI